MYADLASPVSSASSRSQAPAQKQKEKLKPKREEAPRDKEREERRKREVPPQPQKSSSTPKPTQISKPPQLVYSAHKDIKLTLLNKPADKGTRKRYEPSDKERPSSPPSKRVTVSPERGHRDRKAFGRPPSPKGDRQSSRAPAMVRSSPAQAERKRPPSPQSKVSSKVTSVSSSSSKSHDTTASTTATSSAKSSKSSTLSRREELLKQLKAVEDAIARKRAKIPGKVQ
ncbi:hypothetical protein chiPu_0020756 [Chiloscyllium punctatum]|uniref:Zinc finger CCCH domain-containing protein 18 n=3 Tax=Chiloscyllium punctatum TaxID=137246 RepID=A0A401RJD6_CHIPU|nr:hypothetical protein [Chiloscyllium punctatum]